MKNDKTKNVSDAKQYFTNIIFPFWYVKFISVYPRRNSILGSTVRMNARIISFCITCIFCLCKTVDKNSMLSILWLPSHSERCVNHCQTLSVPQLLKSKLGSLIRASTISHRSSARRIAKCNAEPRWVQMSGKQKMISL